MLEQGKSLGEIQTLLQEETPVYKEIKKQEEIAAKKELDEIMADPLKDPFQELVDNLV